MRVLGVPFLEETSILEAPPMCAIEVFEADIRGAVYVRKIKPCNIDLIGQQMAPNLVPDTGKQLLSLS